MEYLLTYKELAKKLHLSIRKLQKCIQNDGLPCVYIGRAVRFDPVKITEWVNKCDQKPNPRKSKEAA